MSRALSEAPLAQLSLPKKQARHIQSVPCCPGPLRRVRTFPRVRFYVEALRLRGTHISGKFLATRNLDQTWQITAAPVDSSTC